jgi:hypothetical protein
MHMPSIKSTSLIGSIACVIFAASCSPQQQQGAAIGALGGGALGAIAGNDSGDVIRGAAIGAAVGTGVGALREDAQRREAAEREAYGNNYGGNNDGRYGPAPQPTRDYPVARRTDNPNHVISPYPPYNVVDVRDIRRGELARDPTTNEIFRVP